MQTKIYYVEDDENIAEGIQAYLKNRNIKVTLYHLISEIKMALLNELPDMVLVDWNLPDGSGDVFCQWIRRHFGEELPILFLTVKDATEDIVTGFSKGADDYLVKPFELEILYARITAVLKRAQKTESNRLYCDKICLDKEKMMVFCKQEEISLSMAEYRLLLYLMENKGKTITRSRLLEEIWDANGSYVNDNTLTVTMKRLREKLKTGACIKTVRSFGYRMEDTL